MAKQVGEIDLWVRRSFLNEMVKNLPTPVQDRVVALKNQQLEQINLKSKFMEEILLLDIKYQKKYKPYQDLRKLIVTGELEPPKVKPKWNTDGEGPNEVEQQEFAELLKEFKDYPADSKGIPYFWLKIFRNTEMLNEMVTERDEEALKKLKDISVKYGDDFSYTLEFHFDENDYFTNTVLTKQYFNEVTVDEKDPFHYDGPTEYKCKGCTIDWKQGMNLTIKTIRVKQKNKARGTVRMVARRIPVDSFFNFFSPPEMLDDEPEKNKAIDKQLNHDFDIAEFFCNKIIPQAILYYDGTIFD